MRIAERAPLLKSVLPRVSSKEKTQQVAGGVGVGSRMSEEEGKRESRRRSYMANSVAKLLEVASCRFLCVQGSPPAASGKAAVKLAPPA